MFTLSFRSTSSSTMMLLRRNCSIFLQRQQQQQLFDSMRGSTSGVSAVKSKGATTAIGGTVLLMASYASTSTTRTTTNQYIAKQCIANSNTNSNNMLLLNAIYSRTIATPPSSKTIITPISTIQNQMLSSASSSLFQRRPLQSIRSASTSTTTSTTTSASSTSTITPPPPSKTTLSFMEWYEGHLSRSPIVTKMITGSFLWGLGDMVAQVIPQISNNNSEGDGSRNGTFTGFTYDYIRTGRAAIFGFAIHAPLSHLHYNFLEYLTVQMKFTGYAIPLFKAFMEQFVYWSWISNSIYFAAMGAMQGLNMTQIIQRIYDVLWETQVAQWTFWIPIQLINFQYTPVRHQLNVVLVTSIVWTALLSMWYPPIQKKEDEGEKK